MKRNKHRLVSKRDLKYYIHRQNWTTYHNILLVYEYTYEEMVSAGVAEKLPEPTWMDKDGNPCEEEDPFGYMVKYKLSHLDQCFIGNKVRGNISVKGDGHSTRRLL